MSNYFREMVLPSVGLPLKNSYNMKELASIFDCHLATVYRMAERGQIRITPMKKVYLKELESFFHKKHPCKAEEEDD